MPDGASTEGAEPLTAHVFRLVQHAPAGITVAELRDRTGRRYRSALVSAVCHQYVKQGHFHRELRPRVGSQRVVAVFFWTGKALRSQRHRQPVSEPVRTALDTHGALTLAEVAWYAGVSRRAAHGALTAMVRGGEVQRIGSGAAMRYTLADEEDEPWQPPTQYVSALRAQILGLKRAA